MGLLDLCIWSTIVDFSKAFEGHLILDLFCSDLIQGYSTVGLSRIQFCPELTLNAS